MLNQIRIKIHKAILGKPEKRVFVNPYAKNLPQNTPTHTFSGFKTPVKKARQPISFPFLIEIITVVDDDMIAVKNAVLSTPKAVIKKIENKKALEEKYKLFEELAYGGKNGKD